MKARPERFLAYALPLLLVISIRVGLPASAQGEVPATGSFRTSGLQVKIVFVGFDRNRIDLDYMRWLLPSYDARWDIRVNFTFTYTFNFASDSFTRLLAGYLKSIEAGEKLHNPFLDKEAVNYFYDANKVEEWLYSNRDSYGGVPQNGYAAIVANLENLPTPHYYRVYYRDIDFGAEFGASKRNHWMVGWGGHYRFYYIDMSAGPHGGSYEHQPLWRFGFEGTRYDVTWLTTYVSQVVEEIVWNLFEPDPLYMPPFSERYHIVVFVFDDDTRVDVAGTLNDRVVKKAFEELVPYAAWEVKTTFASLRRYPELYQVLQNSFDEEDKAYALEPVQNYIEAHLSDFAQGSSGVTVLPAFGFILKEDRGMGSLTKWEVNPIAGKAPGKAIYAFLSVKQIKDSGIGFTQTIIHELGHLMGLRHPHQYGATGTFIASAMSYTQNEYTFSIFNKDFVARTHTDIFLSELENIIQKTEATLQLRKISAKVRDMVDEAKRIRDSSLQAYNSMDYTNALQEAKKALDKAKKVQEESEKLPALAEEVKRLDKEVVTWQILTVCFVAGLIMLLVFTVYLTRRMRTAVPAVQATPPTSRTPPIPAPTIKPSPPEEKFCVNCGSPVPLTSAFCPECGAKQP